MDQKLFLEKLTEVAEWHWEKHQGQAGSSGRPGDSDDVPTYAKLDRIKPSACPYQEGKAGCQWQIYKKGYGKQIPVKVQKCDTCGAVLTPKGKYIANPSTYNYPHLIRMIDQEE